LLELATKLAKVSAQVEHFNASLIRHSFDAIAANLHLPTKQLKLIAQRAWCNALLTEIINESRER
jgi:hypothetical protein